jgi:hypothetical protein
MARSIECWVIEACDTTTALVISEDHFTKGRLANSFFGFSNAFLSIFGLWVVHVADWDAIYKPWARWLFLFF